MHCNRILVSLPYLYCVFSHKIDVLKQLIRYMHL